MSAPNRISPAALESLYKVAIKDTLEQSISRRNAEDIQELRQSFASMEKTMGHLRGSIEGLEKDNRELRQTTDGLKAAVQQFHSSHEQGVVDKKAIKILQQHVQQVDQRQSELENKHEEVERAFEQIAQLMEAGIEEAPPPAPAPSRQHQRKHQQSEDLNPPRERQPARVGIRDEQPPTNRQHRSPPRIPSPPQDHQERRATRTSSHIQQSKDQDDASPSQRSHQPRSRGDVSADPQVDQQQHSTNSSQEKQTNTSDPVDANPKYKALMNHFRETKQKYVEAGKMSKGKEREFVWAFIDGIKDKETCQWVQNIMLDNLPSSMVHPSTKHRGRRHAHRAIALGLDVTWDAVVTSGLKRAKLPPFLA